MNPETEAGRDLLERHADGAVVCAWDGGTFLTRAILAIEQEAARKALADAARRVEDRIAVFARDRQVSSYRLVADELRAVLAILRNPEQHGGTGT